MKTICIITLSLALVACNSTTETPGTPSGDTPTAPTPDGLTAGTDTSAATDTQSGLDTHTPPRSDTLTPVPTDTATPPTSKGKVGDACAAPTDCEGPNATCLNLPGGYCTQSDCAGGTCPEGSACYTFEDAGSYCVKQCSSPNECRVDEGYTCDADKTCWPSEGTNPDPPAGNSPIGGPCTSEADCKDAGATCYPEQGQAGPTGFVNGYCVVWGCTDDSCPAGSSCLTVTQDGGTACFASCANGVACPQDKGYVCSAQSNTCWPGCEGDADCPAGYGCHPDVGGCVEGWSNAPFECDDTSYEPNDSIDKSATLTTPLSKAGVDLCSGDIDWYSTTSAKGKLTTVGTTFNHIQGDLDLVYYNANGTFVGHRLWTGAPESYGANYRSNENKYEYLSVMNLNSDETGYFKVRGYNGATNSYNLEVKTTDWVDGLNCTDHFDDAECAGYTGAPAGKLYQFPFPQANDPYVPSGYSFDSYGSYRWLRRELIMIIRYAIHETQKAFPGTTQLGLIDMCDKEGITPGYDVGDPRHPESTHDQGGNIDIAYYQNDGDNGAESVCGPGNSANDGYFCTSTANHIMDAPRTAYFMAMLAKHSRLRVIGVDKLLAPLIEQAGAALVSQGKISASLLKTLKSRLAYGDGWPFHHHHMHVSMKWWSQGLGNGLVIPQDPPIGCGYRMPGDGPL